MTKNSKAPVWLQKIASLFEPKKVYKKKKTIRKPPHYDLKEIFNEVNSVYFSSSLNLDVSWYGSGITSSKSSIRLGYYNLRTQKIKINRLLDSPQVPKYFVSFILYHEVLHHLYPPICAPRSRRKIHHGLFLQKEKEFERYLEAQTFLKELKKEFFTKKTPTRNSV